MDYDYLSKVAEGYYRHPTMIRNVRRAVLSVLPSLRSFAQAPVISSKRDIPAQLSASHIHDYIVAIPLSYEKPILRIAHVHHVLLPN